MFVLPDGWKKILVVGLGGRFPFLLPFGFQFGFSLQSGSLLFLIFDLVWLFCFPPWHVRSMMFGGSFHPFHLTSSLSFSAPSPHVFW